MPAALRTVLRDERVERLGQLDQPGGQGRCRCGLDLAIAEVGQAVAFRPQKSPAGGGERRIEPEQDQPSDSATASEMS